MVFESGHVYITRFIFEIFDLNKCTHIEFGIYRCAIMFMYFRGWARACNENDELENEFYLVEIRLKLMTTATTPAAATA